MPKEKVVNKLPDPEKRLSELIRDALGAREYKDIISFATTEVDLSGDVSSDRSRLDLDSYPYMIAPLKAATIEKGLRKEVVLAFPEQMGKTTIEMVAILYNVVYNSLQCIVAYPSQELAAETSNVKFIPLFRKIPAFAADLDRPFAIRTDRLQLSHAIIYWQGAGVKIVSKSAKLVLGDECAVWNPPGGINNLEELKKRTRSYRECLQLFVSTPTYKETPFWDEFESGSQGYYFLRCQSCGGLTMRSCDIHNLKFESVYNEGMRLYIPVRGSCRLICPACKHEHAEKDRAAMVKGGDYIHNFPDRVKDRPSFQAGVLASLLSVHAWDVLAAKQLASGSSAELSAAISWDNSYRGLPYQRRTYRKQDEEALATHYFSPGDLKEKDIEAVYIVADTQDTFSVVGTFVLGTDGCHYCMGIERPRYLFLTDPERERVDAENREAGKEPEITVEDILSRPVAGIKPVLLLVDARGHRTDEVKEFSKRKKNILLYMGTTLKFDKWRFSEKNPRIIQADARKWQAEAIFHLYFQKNKKTNFLYLSEDLTEKDLEEIACVKPDPDRRNGQLFENWSPGEHVHDVFDVIKMYFCLLAVSLKILRGSRFQHCLAQVLERKRLTKKDDKSSPNSEEQKRKIPRKPLFI